MVDHDIYKFPSIGILGGGQLGKMLCMAGAQIGMNLHILDKSVKFPAGQVCPNFTEGDFMDYQDVIAFGADKDVITIEIEKVNVDALIELEGQGKKVFPQPDIIKTIQDKGFQKDFFRRFDIPTSPFQLYEDLDDCIKDINSQKINYPFVQKLRREGYDGRGVQIIQDDKDLAGAFQHDFLIEECISIDKEIAVIVCRNQQGEMSVYDPVEMIFDPKHNILLYQLCPVDLTPDQYSQIRELAMQLADTLGLVGLLAVEMFLDMKGQILINELAPRPHNSGHHTIESCYCSQYANHLRVISGLTPVPGTRRSSSLLMNVLGEQGYQGPPVYEGIDEILAMEGVFLHIYGKEITKPYRKMGHITIVGEERDTLVDRYHQIKNIFKVRS